ncbi:MAG: zf-HC2 domain-containing protein [Candidatus Krumholzibacteria bacterium]|jgi:predicted anti-sigma-YlaC factor YlaD|nr:zf-HC2 domain-containing protein [Candidatus Krumholzibacteria bacterium]
MNCRDFRKLVSKRMDGEATRPEEETLRLHLESCADCRAFSESLAAIAGLHRGLAELEPRAGLLETIPGPKRFAEHLSIWWKTGIAAAAAAVVLLGIMTGGYVAAGFSAGTSADQAEVSELDYLGAYPPGSLGEALMSPAEGEDDV